MSKEHIQTQIQRLKGRRLQEPHRRKEFDAEIKTLEAGLEIEEVRDQLTELGIKFHPATGLEKLKARLKKSK